MTNNLYREVYDSIFPTLKDAAECEAITRRILQHYFNLSTAELLSNKEISLMKEERDLLKGVLARIHQHEPLQYIMGEADFLGRTFKVNSHVLIPRPETEEMVHAIIHEGGSYQHIIDIGTGSGCIAISLKKAFPQAHVWGVDVSPSALKVAQENAAEHQAEINFVQMDILKEVPNHPSWDLIVSNPPYVCTSEQSLMRKNVLDYEPSLALFVEDQDPLVFYQRIATIARQHLTPGGKVLVEINERFSEEVKKLFQEAGLLSVSIHKDLQKKPRWILASR